MSYSRSFKVTVTVASGVGTGSFTFPNISGIKMRTIIIIPPGGAVYDWYIKDVDGYAVSGALASSGSETHSVDIPISSSGTVNFVNATDGSYIVKIWAEYN